MEIKYGYAQAVEKEFSKLILLSQMLYDTGNNESANLRKREWDAAKALKAKV